MNKFVLPLVLATGLALTACGSSSSEADEPRATDAPARASYAECMDKYEADIGFPDGVDKPEFHDHRPDVMDRDHGFEIVTELPGDQGFVHCMVMLDDEREIEDVVLMH